MKNHKSHKSILHILIPALLAWLTVSPALAAGETLVPMGSVWKYHDRGVGLLTAWIQPGYDDSQWSRGPAQLGYGNGDEATIVSYGPDSGNKYITTYFRHAFVVANAASCTNLMLRLLRDDGAVVYLNGMEVVRTLMPAGPVNYQTYAASTTAVDGFLVVSSIFPSSLVEGTNVLAVEIHQVSPVSSDISFDLELVSGEPLALANFLEVTTNAVFTAPANLSLTAKAATPVGVTNVKFYVNGAVVEQRSMLSRLYAPFNRQFTAASNYTLAISAHDNGGFSKTSVVEIAVEPAPAQSTVLVGMGAPWRFLDDGSEPGIAWRAPGYNDAGWSNGPAALGYSKPGLATSVRSTRTDGSPITTTYFRHAWEVPAPTRFRKLAVRVLGDDGAKVYVNGAEVFRNNLPSDLVSASTPALEATDPATFASGAYADAALLVAGTNVLAAEVHQASSGVADLVFDLDLVAFSDPSLSIQVASTNTLLLSWPYPSTGYRLIGTPDLAPADWSDVTNTSAQVGSDLQLSMPCSGASRFFRLLKAN